ncbi:hypothetical protein ACLIBG_01105 [Virgibacillus sp. W0181]
MATEVALASERSEGHLSSALNCPKCRVYAHTTVAAGREKANGL